MTIDKRRPDHAAAVARDRDDEGRKMASFVAIDDPRLPRPNGFVHGVLSDGKAHLFIAGQIALNADGKVAGEGDIVAQFGAAIRNFSIVLNAAGCKPEHVVKLNIFTTDIDAYLSNSRRIGELYREVFGQHYPAMTLVQIARLVRKECIIEIEGVAGRPF
jgi:enamine deaminase RidA (YjgF/YER057c/UK114 family)